jgi:hypothetical protein
VNETTHKPRAAVEPALRPLSGLIGRGSELGRVIGHLDARRSVRLEAPRGAGVTALLRALCGEPPRPASPDGTIALPVGLPVADLPAVATMLQPDSTTPVGGRRMLVLLDDRDLTGDDVAFLQDGLAHSLLVVTAEPTAPDSDLAPVAVNGLSQHHAVGLVEAAMGRPLTIEEGRAARTVATAVDGMPGPLVQAAAAVRDGGLTFDDVLDVLDDPPRPTALAIALQDALGDELHVTLSHLRALGDTPATTRVAAAACGLEIDEAERRLKRLAMLGLVSTDGRGGWAAASGIPEVSEPVRAGACTRVAEWLGDEAGPLDVFDVATVLAAVADRMDAGDHPATMALAQAGLNRLPLAGLEATRRLLEGATTWAMPEPSLADEPSAPETSAPEPSPVEADAGLADADEADADEQLALVGDEEPVDQPTSDTDDAERSGTQSSVLGLLGDRRRLALVAVAAAAVIAAVLLVVPSLRDDTTPAVIRGDIDLGVASLGETTSGTLTLDLSSTTAAGPVSLVLDGPDADSFTVDPARCTGLDCRASVTFTPDRSGIHLASVNAVDADEAQVAVAELTGSGTGDPSEVTASTNLGVTLFPSEPTPIPAGGEAVVPIGVRNNGPDDSTGSQLVIGVPERVTADAPGCTFESSTLTCPLAELAAGSSERVQVTLTLPRRADAVRVDATVSPLADTDDVGGDNAAGFTYPVVAPDDEPN